MKIFSYFFKNPLQILSFTANLFDFTTREDQDPPLQWMGVTLETRARLKRKKRVDGRNTRKRQFSRRVFDSNVNELEKIIPDAVLHRTHACLKRKKTRRYEQD